MTQAISAIVTQADFEAVADSILNRPNFVKPAAFAMGWAEVSPAGKILCVHFPTVNYGENYRSAAIFTEVCGRDGTFITEEQFALLETAFTPFLEDKGKRHRNIEAFAIAAGYETSLLVPIEDLQAPPKSTADAYLRLHLLSHRKVKPNTINLDGIFGLLPNVVWTDVGAWDSETYEADVAVFQLEGNEPPKVFGMDKFPPMLDFVIPSGVRIADASRVRLGAYLAEGTTVMHEGFVNFNAGTLGKSMVEGRISQGVIIDEGSDLGGGSSTMGTLSGGGKEKIFVGKRCLIGANSGIGISLGDDCKVESGLYITASTHVRKPDETFVKAIELSGQSGMTFYRNEGGVVVVVPTKGEVELNPALHA